MNASRVVAAALALVLAALPAAAQQMKTVDGIVINIGIVRAIDAEHVDAQHGVHKGGHSAGAEHIVAALADRKSGARIADAEVSIEVRDPKGKLEKKALMAMTTAGFPDYSEVFQFGWTGKYRVRVIVKPKGAAKPLEAKFTLSHVI